MLTIKLESDLAAILSSISKHPVLSKAIASYEIDEEFVYIPKSRFQPADMKKLIEEGLASQI